MARYKDPSQQALYDSLLKLAEDKTSELYWEGNPRRGPGIRCAFWDGFVGLKRSANVIPGTMSAACFMAGKEYAKRLRRKEAKGK